MAIDDGIFAAGIKQIDDVYSYSVPEYLMGEPLKIKRKSLDQPVFRKVVEGTNGKRTSINEPMTAAQWYRYLVALDIAVGLKYRLTQYVWRRSLIMQSTARHLRRSSGVSVHEAVQRAAHGLLLDADITAPTELPDDLQCLFDNDSTLTELRDKKAEVLEAIKSLGFSNMLTAKGKTPLYDKWKSPKAELNRETIHLHEKLMKMARDRHFRNAATERMDRHLKDTAKENSADRGPPPLPVFQIPERNQLVEIILQRSIRADEDENSRRQRTCRLWTALQRRKEFRHPGKHSKKHLARLQAPKPGSVSIAVAVAIPATRDVPVEVDPLACPFCVADGSLPDGDRLKIWDKLNKVWDHVEKNVHRNELEAYSSGTKQCGLCKMKNVEFVPSSTMGFKRHILDVHNWRFRGYR
ncbi:hypothetical protein ACJ73_06037 [Blastomyces percursus]|uniref:FluG domain-containing protein n=1 Tax=Blastomyces percursus TaxID=1658174 RepID=A0A1J9R4Q6_9EURO|nr:hypothetical protein ACJ73_06037 [Blastomyces percursus]